jgi:hypothetical protein
MEILEKASEVESGLSGLQRASGFTRGKQARQPNAGHFRASEGRLNRQK